MKLVAQTERFCLEDFRFGEHINEIFSNLALEIEKAVNATPAENGHISLKWVNNRDRVVNPMGTMGYFEVSSKDHICQKIQH